MKRIKKILKDIGLDYQTIDACEYNCMLFYKDNAGLDWCLKCLTSRWMSHEGGYFPLKPPENQSVTSL